MVTGGEPTQTLDDLQIHQYRKLGVEYLERACNWGEIDKQHPIYTEVTEGRDHTPDQQKTYSSCGDIPHGMYEDIGVRAPWVNRKSRPGGWKMRWNLIFLEPKPIGANPIALLWDRRKLEGCDVVIVGSDDWKHLHTITMIDQLNDGCLCTAEYGVSGMMIGGVGGKLKTYERFDGIHIGAKKILSVLPFDLVLRTTFTKGQFTPKGE